MEAIKQEFEVAVYLVQKLPKNGPFKPSDNVRLRFYALYKQAMVGPNTSQQPSFVWDPVGRYKWKAWTDLGSMDEAEAMRQYVLELKDLVRKIPDTNDSAAFLSIFREKFEVEEGYNTMERSQGCVEVVEGKGESDTEEYCDTLTKPDVEETKANMVTSNSQHSVRVLDNSLDNSPNSNTEHSSDSTQDTSRKKRKKQSKKPSDSLGSSEACSSDVRIIDVESQILRTLRLMRQDVRGLLKRMDTLENLLVRHLLSEQHHGTALSGVWERRWLIFIVTWPVLTQLIGLWYVRRYYRKRL